MDNTFRFLGSSTLGVFGAGRLGRAIIHGLLRIGFPQHSLVICHAGSKETHREIAESGLAGLLADRHEVVHRSKIVFYLVRPQDYTSIGDCTMRGDSLLVSFLAGVPLARLPVNLIKNQRVRVMTSSPDTVRQQNGIAAIYPPDNAIVQEILTALRLRVFPLRRESDVHVFTALGPCLPIALTCWEGLGHAVDEAELLETAIRYDLPGYAQVLEWARAVRPQSLSADERERYVSQATTPGGVTEAIVKEMEAGRPLSVALVRGIDRSRELAAE